MFTRSKVSFGEGRLLGRLLPLAIMLLLFSACEMGRLRSAEDLYNGKRYAAAIVEFDDLIKSAGNGAIVTRAELLRSASYAELGEAAIQRKNWPLAVRFLKLANSDSANMRLAEIYMNLGNEASTNGDQELAKSYLDAIIREAPNSPLIPEAIYKRLEYFLNVVRDQEAAWSDYMSLYDDYPNNPFEIEARSYVQQFIPGKLQYAALLNKQGYYADALNILFELSKYPVVDGDQLNKQISDIYQSQAEDFIVDQNYTEADRMFRIAMQYYPAKKDAINKRLQSITSLYVRQGDSLLEAGDYDNALVYYRKTFDIIPDYQPALDAINRLFTIKENIKNAAATFAEGERQEAAGKYADALKQYNAAYALNKKSEYQQKAVQMQNLIDAARNPAAFARKIIDQYRGGIINTRLREQKQLLMKQYKASEIQDSGWQILLSTGQYKYEARYDLLTPGKAYLYLWQVNLREGSIIPLNKLSEAMLK